MAQYTFTGYDASAHVSEETHDAAVAAPRGIVSSVVVSLVAGFLLLFAVTWAVQDFTAERQSATGFPPAQIFIDAAGGGLARFWLSSSAWRRFSGARPWWPPTRRAA